MPQVTAIKAYSKGFACSAGPGTVCLFEKTEEKCSYRQIKEIRVSTDSLNLQPQIYIRSVVILQVVDITLCVTDHENVSMLSNIKLPLAPVVLLELIWI